jgi:acetylornithine deacetylase/succinyl-diaminopimelate desuccinylase-like protein
MSSPNDTSPIYERPAELLQQLIRFDTTNPPGDEAECIRFISDLLTQAGIKTTILAAKPERANVVARVPGRGTAAPLLLYGHVDVVTTANQQWDYPPFEGRLVDGYVWGRGAVDMKGGIAMMLSALLRAHAEGLDLPGDVVFAAVSDEEAGQGYGAKYLVETHPDLFEGIKYAIGEAGAFSWYVGGRRFYPIMLAERQRCIIQATVRGPGGHGSRPVRGGAMAKLAQLLQQLDACSLPVHITPVPRLMLEFMASELGEPMGQTLEQLLDPTLTDDVLARLGDLRPLLNAMLHNTVSPTILHGSEKINVIPSEVSVELDSRVLPGYEPEDIIAELRQIVGQDVELEVTHREPARPAAGMGMFDMLADVLLESDPDGLPVPLLVVGGTDARQFARLGIETYGFLPTLVPEDVARLSLSHAANERVPVSAIHFGTNAIYEVLQRFGG